MESSVDANANADADANAAPSAAPEAAPVDKKILSKAERKKLAAEAFAKQGGAPRREKMSKQERRQLQEAQRKAKQGGQPVPTAVPTLTTSSGSTAVNAPAKPSKKAEPTASSASSVRLQYDDAKRMAKRSKDTVVVRTMAQKQVAWFSHLPQYERESSLSLSARISEHEIHPSVVSLGLQFAEGKISGANARCIAMLTAFRDVVAGYSTPPQKMLNRDLDRTLKPMIQYLIDCRPHCVGMGNAIRRLRNVISTLSPELSDQDAKQQVLDEIDDFIDTRILLAMTAIAKTAQSKIVDGDVILTFGCSNVIERVLREAKKERHINFRVIVVDARPLYEGKRMLKMLLQLGIPSTYVQINALSYVMRDVTKVLLGTSAFLSNGVAVAHVGTALVAMTAHDAHVPVLFCCETYKFSERVQLDAITHNELRDADDLVSSTAAERTQVEHRSAGTHVLSDWRDLASLKLLHLVYDVTPSEYVSMVITEVGMIPPTSIPAIIREFSKDGKW